MTNNGQPSRVKFANELIIMQKQNVWLVCGITGELGEATLRYLLLRNQQVVAILSQETALELYHKKFPLLDLRCFNVFNAPDTEQAVRQILKQYGKIDKLINIGDAGLLSMNVLKAMQVKGNGHIIQLDPGQSHVKSSAAINPFNMQSQDESGIYYTFLGPDSCFQSMLLQKTISNKQKN